jgi:hypothetical protein
VGRVVELESTVFGHPLLDQLDAALTDLVPKALVALNGAWSSRMRRSYQSKDQVGSGAGPFVEVVDHLWDGQFESPDPFTGMAFLRTNSGLYWAKAAHASPTVPVRVSLHAYASHTTGHLTFAAGLGDVVLPGVPVPTSSDLPRACLVALHAVPVGRVVCIAKTDATAFFVVLLQRESVKFGRNRLWRLRDPLASSLPQDVRELMTRRRAGVLRTQPSS